MAGIEILGDGGRKSMPNATLSPAEWFCIKIASDKSHLNVSLIVSSKAEVGCPQIIKFGEEKKKGGVEPGNRTIVVRISA